MPYALPFVKVNIEGHFGLTAPVFAEYWTCGFHITKNGGVIGGTSELTAFLTSIRTAISTYHVRSDVVAGAATWLDAVSGAYIGTDGKYALGSLQTTTRVPMAAPVAGVGTTSNDFPRSVVLTLRSLLNRGPASHGRIYYPACSMNVGQGTGVIAAGTCTSLATNAKVMLDAINVAAATNFGAGAAIGLVSPKGAGFQSPVIKVGVGQKVDHMESRERDIKEAHVFATTAAAAALLDDLDDDFRRRIADEFPDSDLP